MNFFFNLLFLANLLLATDSGDSAVLFRLNIAAAFDTADHTVLISRLELCGIKGAALNQFRSYLYDRSFSVSLGESGSSSV